MLETLTPMEDTQQDVLNVLVADYRAILQRGRELLNSAFQQCEPNTPDHELLELAMAMANAGALVCKVDDSGPASTYSWLADASNRFCHWIVGVEHDQAAEIGERFLDACVQLDIIDSPDVKFCWRQKNQSRN